MATVPVGRKVMNFTCWFSDDQWHFLAITMKRRELEIFIDGKSIYHWERQPWWKRFRNGWRRFWLT